MVLLKLIILTLLISHVNNFKPHKSDEFGPYVAVWDGLDICKGPKPFNATKLSSALEKKQGSYIWALNITYFKTTKIDEMRIQVFSRNGNHKKVVWSNKITNPCNNYLTRSIMQEYYPDANGCEVKKGDYFFHANLTDIMYKFFGKSFVYGNYQTKAIVLSKGATVSCFVASVRYMKP